VPTAFFMGKLKAGTTREEYRSWVVNYDYPAVARLKSILAQRIYWVVDESLSGPSGVNEHLCDYIEIIQFTKLDEYIDELNQSAITNEISRQLPEYVDVETLVAMVGESCNAGRKSFWNAVHTASFLFARRRHGVTNSEIRRWVNEVAGPLLNENQYLLRSEIFELQGLMSNTANGGQSFDFSSASYMKNPWKMNHELSQQMGWQVVTSQLSEFFQTPVVRFTAEPIQPGVFRVPI